MDADTKRAIAALTSMVDQWSAWTTEVITGSGIGVVNRFILQLASRANETSDGEASASDAEFEQMLVYRLAMLKLTEILIQAAESKEAEADEE